MSVCATLCPILNFLPIIVASSRVVPGWTADERLDRVRGRVRGRVRVRVRVRIRVRVRG